MVFGENRRPFFTILPIHRSVSNARLCGYTERMVWDDAPESFQKPRRGAVGSRHPTFFGKEEKRDAYTDQVRQNR